MWYIRAGPVKKHPVYKYQESPMILILYFLNRFCLWKHDLPEEERSHTTLLGKWADQKGAILRQTNKQTNNQKGTILSHLFGTIKTNFLGKPSENN